LTEQTARAAVDYMEEVYKELCSILKASYAKAVEAPRHGRDEAEAHENPRNEIGDFFAEMERLTMEEVTISFCAKLARLLILAWTYQVNLIRWENDYDPNLELVSLAKFKNANATQLLKLDDMHMNNKIGALGL
jgi:hypothetical protein